MTKTTTSDPHRIASRHPRPDDPGGTHGTATDLLTAEEFGTGPIPDIPRSSSKEGS